MSGSHVKTTNHLFLTEPVPAYNPHPFCSYRCGHRTEGYPHRHRRDPGFPVMGEGRHPRHPLDRRTDGLLRPRLQPRLWMEEVLTSERGMYHRSMRPVQSEAVLRQIKYDDGCNRFRYRGSILTSAEYITVAIADNMKKMGSEVFRHDYQPTACFVKFTWHEPSLIIK